MLTQAPGRAPLLPWSWRPRVYNSRVNSLQATDRLKRIMALKDVPLKTFPPGQADRLRREIVDDEKPPKLDVAAFNSSI